MPDYFPIHGPIPRKGKKRLEIGKIRNKRKTQTSVCHLEFVYYLVVLSRDSKQFHFLLFSFMLKKTSENDKAEAQQMGKKERLDLMQFRQKSVRCFPAYVGVLLSHAESR